MHRRSHLAAWLVSLYLLIYIVFLGSGQIALRMAADRPKDTLGIF